jgi:hypothetical protein
MSSLISTVAQAMQFVLLEKAEEAAHDSGFVQRKSPLGGAVFAQSLRKNRSNGVKRFSRMAGVEVAGRNSARCCGQWRTTRRRP